MPGCGRWPGRWAPLLLAALLLLAHPRGSAAVDIGGAVSNAAQAVKGVFGGGGNESNGGGGSQASAGSAASFGPIVAKTARAAAALAGLGSGNATVHQLPLGDAANVTLIKDPSRPHSLVLAFEAAPSLSADGATNSVPFLERFAATAEAPQTMLEAFLQGVEGPGTQGALADAAAELAGPDALLHVLCTGAGAGGGGLALLCGPWAAMQFPLANADVITFAADWNPCPLQAGFNTQFAWSFIQLAVLHYQWPFPLTDPALTGALASRNASAIAEALSGLITTDSLKQALAVPNLPSPLPPDYSPSYTGEELGSLAPVDSDLEPPPSDCPLILCKTRDAAAAACAVFDQGGEHKAFPANDFRPGNLSGVIPGVKVHKGFLNQHDSFTTKPKSDQENITAVLLGLSGGTQPQRIVAAGHSLGAALSELTAVWASTIWPEASILNANTGAPRVGDDAWELEFTATVGRAYRYAFECASGRHAAATFPSALWHAHAEAGLPLLPLFSVNHLDQVPVLPPFDSFKQVPHGLWLRDNLVLLQDDKARIAAAFDSMAEGYSEWVVDRQLVPGMFQAFVTELEPELRGRAGAQILDVASASGEPAASLAAALPLATVHATDLTPRFVELGAARAARLGLRNLRCQVADGERLERFGDASCDAVCCCMGLMFIPNVQAALAAFARVLKPGGALLATVAQPPDVQPFWTFLSELAEEICPSAGSAPAEAPYPLEFGPCRFGNPQPLLDAAAAAGLRSIACRPLLLDYQLAAGEWWSSLSQMPDAPIAAALARLQAAGGDADAAEQARQLTERRLREHGWLEADGSVRCPGNGAWLIAARKGSQ
ncbi:hypothetical protein COHA_005851 [Chlorella ohadii]|uniref:Methyltransferase type 11 domain-containing protein n=1 Tax=Chlorella ohadii TaxID=2649997 RepID=A0AAD5DR13_9CHLO|nr:hypothetical protein COHA_005851 [Chlorella ohadii]